MQRRIQILKLTKEEHIKKHVELHKALDELVADMIMCIPGFLPSNASLMYAMKWSHEQLTNPTEVK
jgi:hypothetical protein